MKTIKEWYNELPEDVREKAINNTSESLLKKRKKTMKREEDKLKYHINRLDVMNKSLHNNVPEMVEKLKEISKNKKHE